LMKSLDEFVKGPQDKADRGPSKTSGKDILARAGGAARHQED